jgi:hypothetical protein
MSTDVSKLVRHILGPYVLGFYVILLILPILFGLFLLLFSVLSLVGGFGHTAVLFVSWGVIFALVPIFAAIVYFRSQS